MKRLLTILILALLLCSALCAISAEEAFDQALANSEKGAEISQSRRNEFVDQVISLMNGPNWTISLQSLEITGKDDLRSPASITLPTLEVGFSTPENKDKVTYEARLSVGGPVFNWNRETDRYTLDGFSYSLHAGLSKSFEFKSWDTTNYKEGQADKVNTNNYRSSLMQFENSFLEDLIKALKWSESIRDLNTEALLLQSQYNQDIKDGKLVADSPEAILRYADVEMKNKEVEQAIDSGESDFADFKKNYGMDAPFVDSAQEYPLEFEPIEEGNTEVMSKYYDYLTILQQIDEKTGKSSQFNVKASIEPKVTMDENFVYKTTVLNGELGATYTSGNLSVDMSFNTGYDFRADSGSKITGPTLSFSLSWSNTPQVLSSAETERLKLLYTNYSYDKQTQEVTGRLNWNEYETTLRNLTNETLRKESLELEKLQYDASVAHKEWLEALAQYRTKCNEMNEAIREYKNKREVFLIKYEADKKAYDQAASLFDQGKSSVAEMLKMEHLVEMDAIELVIFNMQSHILYNNIQMLQM